ncbi:hypothetical protein BSPWISOXPB_11383 [uncultured Gammaproteobacteria bacterium]|nr:hypothetical protein BSPWISOXPB_11383 [uncultured Gammaproteobacteria bacterium]
MVQDEDTCGNGTTTSGWKGRVICYAGPGRKINVSKNIQQTGGLLSKNSQSI